MELEVLLDFGAQPVLNRFEPKKLSQDAFVHLRLGQCRNCGLIQLMDLVPVDAMRPRRAMVYREPERHLDEVVNDVVRIAGVGVEGLIGALTCKDDSTLERLKKRGFKRCWRPDLGDFGIEYPFANIETIQALLDRDQCRRITERNGNADIVIARHILEHCSDPRCFLDGMSELLARQGVLVIEVPDCTKSLELNDYSMIWEEHALYFTPQTVVGVLEQSGFQILDLKIHPYPFEDVIVVVARPEGEAKARAELQVKQSDDVFSLAARYAENFKPFGSRLERWLFHQREQGTKFCAFGAGHLTAAFINLNRIEKFFDFVIDDNEWKTGNFLPGTKLKIEPSDVIGGGWSGICLLGVNPDTEPMIYSKFEKFGEDGGTFHSILADSPSSIYQFLT